MMRSCAPSGITVTSRHRRKLRSPLFAQFTEITGPMAIKHSAVAQFSERLAEEVIDGRVLRHAFESLDDDGSEEISGRRTAPRRRRSRKFSRKFVEKIRFRSLFERRGTSGKSRATRCQNSSLLRRPKSRKNDSDNCFLSGNRFF